MDFITYSVLVWSKLNTCLYEQQDVNTLIIYCAYNKPSKFNDIYRFKYILLINIILCIN